MRLVWGLVIGVLIWAFAMMLAISITHAHDWIEAGGYPNSTGTMCCTFEVGGANEHHNSPPDCAAIPCDEAWVLGVGSPVNVPLPHGTIPTVINSVFASQDTDGRCFACGTGCLFRTSGY